MDTEAPTDSRLEESVP